MKNLIIYYSLEGNTRFIAEVLAKELNADTVELKTRKTYAVSGFRKYFRAGMEASMKLKPKLTNPEIKLSAYDTLWIGTPVWAGTYASPFNTFFHSSAIKGKKIALFACSGSGNAEKCFQKIKDRLSGNEFIGELSFIDPAVKDEAESTRKAAEWAHSLKRI